ncbi:PrsW family intramembrane metalloprotease [Nonomuraea sp. NBC_01738]|uniref:PrsW family intramembrane metalloprotease n=1 Tax=Nonomuraea sp. NBC_01738 TaxID=2976003 RepID=UPI002E0E6C45|nr:PrsW family intramembrane metalloprotease [Nonomuraea sp. NBC_01738]
MTVDLRPPAPVARPSKALIIGLGVSSALAALVLTIMLLSGGPAGFGLSFALALVPLPVLLAAILGLDRLEPEPRLHLAFAFAWGAGVAIVFGIVLTLAGQAVVSGFGYGDKVAEDVGTVLLAPVIEEGLKGCALLLLLRRRREIDGLTDGIIYAGMTGLGFAVIENVGYYLGSFGEGGLVGAMETFVLRGLISPLGHPVYTSLIGIGAAYAALHRRYWAIPLGYLGAVFLHFLWNGSATSASLGLFALAYVVIMAVIVVLVLVTVRERRALVARMATVLPAYAQTGLITPQDITMLSTLRARRHARRWSRKSGYGSAMADYQQAATELTMLHLRGERERMDLTEFAGQRDALLTHMAAARRWNPA